MRLGCLVAIASIIGIAACGSDDDLPGRCPDHDPLRRPFFGDLHVHTALSIDASLRGTRLRPDGAYDFARGAEVGLPPLDLSSQPHRTARIDRPLDFLAVTDHAEYLAEVAVCNDPDRPPGYDSLQCNVMRSAPVLGWNTLRTSVFSGKTCTGSTGDGGRQARRAPCG